MRRRGNHSADQDFDGDGSNDILIRNTVNNAWWLYEMDANNISNSGRIAATTNALWQPESFEDFDGDGKTDILVRHIESNAWYLYQMDGDTVSEAGRVGASTNENWQLVQ